MDEFTIVILVLAVALAIVTVVGHGIWVLLGAIFGGKRKSISSSQARMLADGRFECPRCHTPVKRDQQVCDVCDWPHAGARPADGTAALRILSRQVEVLSQQGALDAETRGQLATVIAQQEQRLVQQAAAAALRSAAAMSASAISPEAVPAPPKLQSPASPALPVPAAEAASPSPPLPLAKRARVYAESRGAAMSEALAEPVAPAEPTKKREALSRLFAAFMEEKNIRWGELVGGLLIVGCSIALVISLWSKIASQPLLKFALFNGVTAALFGVGIYTNRRWKIHTTSHGILVIATLLVPLNFLAIAAFTQSSPPTDFLSLAGEGISLIGFALLVYFAGRILVPLDAVLLAAGVMIPCLMQLLIRRFAGPATPLATLYALAIAPVVTYVATVAVVTRRRWLRDAVSSLDEVEANRVLAFLGLASAATIMPLALLLHNGPPITATLHWLSPLGTVCGLPALLVGLLFWRRMSDRARTGLQTAGVAVGALGALVMAGTIVLAWPDPATLLPTAIVTAAVMTFVAFWSGIPAAHVPGGVAIAIACLIGFYLMRGDVGWTLADSAPIKSALLSATSGHALVPLVAMLGLIGWLLRWFGRREDGRMYALVTAATAAASLALVVRFGFAHVGDPENATWTLAIYAIAALFAAVAFERTDVARVGSALLFATLVQAIVYRINPQWQLEQPWIVALLAHGTLTAVGCAVLGNLTGTFGAPSALSAARRIDVIGSLAFSALVTSISAAVWIIATALAASAGALAAYLAWLGGVWLLLAALTHSPQLFTASQITAVLAVFCGVTAAVETHEWYTASPHPWLDPWFVEAQGVALAAYCLVLGALRWGIASWNARDDESVLESPPPRWLSTAATLLDPPWPAVDRVVSMCLVALMSVIATYAVVPGVAQELSPPVVVGSPIESPIEQFEIARIPHVHAFDRGGWLLLAAVAISSTAGLWRRRADWRRIELAFAAMVMCLLLAARWESQVAVASALRWLSAGLFAIGSAAAWVVQRAAATGYASAAPGPALAEPVAPISANAAPRNHEFRDLLVAFITLIYVAMGVYVVQSSLLRAGMNPSVQGLWPWVMIWAVVAGAAAIAVPYAAAIERRSAESLSANSSQSWAIHARWLMLLLAAAPAAILLTFAVAKALDQQPLAGPDPTSWFYRLGYEFSYGLPLVLIALTFIGYAILDRAGRFAFAAGLLFNVVATIVVLLRLARGSGVLDAAAWIDVAQVNAIVAGLAALVWQAAVTLHQRKMTFAERQAAGAGRWPLLLVTQVALAAALCGAFLIPAAVRLAIEWSPLGALPNWVAAAGSPLGWCGIGLAAAAAVWLSWRLAVRQIFVAIIVAALVSMIALTVLRQGGGDWPAYHTLMVGCCIGAWLLPVSTLGANRLIAGSNVSDQTPPMWSAWPVRVFDVAAAWLAIWEYSTAASWWVVVGLAAIGLRNTVVAWREGRRGFVWVAAVLIAFATSVWWLDLVHKAAAMREIGDFFAFLWVDVLAVAALAVISVAVERRHVDVIPEGQSIRRGLAFHRFAAWAIVATLLLTTGAGLVADLMHDSFAISRPLAWAAWFAGAIAATACLWDSRVRWPVACLYCVGLVAVGMYLDGLDLRAPMFHWALANALAAYSLATSALWSAREQLRSVAARLGVPIAQGVKPPLGRELWVERQADGVRARWNEGSGHGWLVTANLLIGIGVLLLVCWIEMSMESFTQRMVAAYAVGAQSFALGLLARGAVRTSLQYLALVWGVLFAVAFGWAWLPPDFPATWLHRLIVTVVALVVIVVVYGFGLVKFLRRENEWTRAAARLVPPLSGLATALILVVLGMEVAAYVQTGGVPIVPAAMAAVAVALAGLAAAALVAALAPGRDPLGLSERGRTLYVYAAEALAALLFLHIRVTMPWLFTGWFQQFWPLIVMVIAFVGVGFGELFQRRQQRVLSEPLETTGALLPLLPAIGFWVPSSDMVHVHYSLILLSIGVLYAALSVLRNSFMYGVLAALAANGSLWYFLHQREGLDLTEHPQLWLIPPALCGLAAGYINRERLTVQQSAALRYASAIVIYVSSTADEFINGVAEAPWLPGVLAGLSILGVLAGILLRVRAFLYLGVAFLVVALMTIIWHAAEGHTWIWWITGIVTGALIFALFGLFEKRRDDVLRVVEELKHWEA